MTRIYYGEPICGGEVYGCRHTELSWVGQPSSGEWERKLVRPSTPDDYGMQCVSPRISSSESTHPIDVVDFARKHGLEDELNSSTKMAQEYFSSKGVQSYLEVDPDSSDHSWIVIEVLFREGQTKNIYKMFTEFCDRWSDAVRGQAHDLMTISYAIK